MKVKTSEEIEKLIEVLDEKLFNGFHIAKNLKEQYFKHRDEENFNIDEYLSLCAEAVNGWHKDVFLILQESLGKHSHYLYHLSKPPTFSSVYTNMPEKLSDVVIKFEKHLDQLENVVSRLEEREGLLIRQEVAKQGY